MSKLQIICFLLLVGFSTSSFAFASEITLNFQNTLSEHKNYEPQLLKSHSNVTAKCEMPSAKNFSGKIDVYSVSYRGFNTCNITEGKLLGSLHCGPNHHQTTKLLDFANKKGETYYVIGFAHKENEGHKRALHLCKRNGTYKAKHILHFCDPVITQQGKACTMKFCPLSLGLGDGRIKDEQLSASSKLDDNHAAKQGRASLISSNYDSSWCVDPASDPTSQYLQVDLRSIHKVSAVSTQGAVNENSWVSTYLVHYSLDGKDWIVLTDKGGEIKEFKGNADQSSLVRHWLEPHFHARFVRFAPLSWVGQRCMRVELHGCKKANTSLEKPSENEPRRCGPNHCVNTPHSTCFMYSGNPLCKCVQSCALDLGKVCGTDGVTYPNECEMQKAACSSEKQINISKRQPCPEPGASCQKNCTAPYSSCVIHNGSEERCECPRGCSRVLKQVCGSDKVTYNNKCLLEKAACENNEEITIVETAPCEEAEASHRVICGALVCPPYSKCDSAGNCVCANCSHDGEMVCGSDGETYNDFCKLQKVACESNTTLSVTRKGPCQEAVDIPRVICGALVCPPYSKCDSAGNCVCANCSHDGEMVCGSDGETYNDFCKLQKVACESNTTLSVTRKGPCQEPGASCQKNCTAPYSSCVVHNGSEERCECPQGCSKVMQQVCGSDKVTYNNKCLLEKAACENNEEITIVETAPCEEPRRCEANDCANIPYSTCVMEGDTPQCKCVQSCTLDVAKVCGTDGVTYQNECEMQKAACSSKKQITVSKRQPCTEPRRCEANDCINTPYSTCVMEGDTPQCKCVRSCALSAEKVCGTDGVTYQNECEMQKAACLSKKQINVSKRQPCPEPVASCQKKCTAPYSSCVIHSGSEERCECPQGCSKVIQQVCGSDKVTYNSKCLLEKAACENNKEITIVKPGPCEGAVASHRVICGAHVCPPYSKCDSVGNCVCADCSNDGKMVCGSDGRTYNDFCKLQKKACEKNSTLKMAWKGPCQECTKKTCPPYANCVRLDSRDVCICPDCTPKGGQVCGSDGRTYKHSCELEKHACEKNKRILIASRGGCSEPIRKSDEEEENKETMFGSSFKTLYICTIVVAFLGIAIALAMCVSQPANRRTTKYRRRDLDKRERKITFNSPDKKDPVEDNTEKSI